MPVHTVLGIMSGTSLDGLDLCLTEFKVGDKLTYTIKKAITVSYPSSLRSKLADLTQSTESFLELDVELMRFYAEQIEKRFGAYGFDFISSHGQTVFHNPEKSYSFQLGSGSILAKLTNKKVVSDFRVGDIALGGQGAPLVPIGDRDLFKEFDNCLNLGGFANVSFDDKSQRVAFDICAINFVLNQLANQLGKEYDENGDIAAKGVVDHELLTRLNAIPFYNELGPKSLGAEWVQNVITPIIANSELKTEDLMATYSEHCAYQIAKNLKQGSCLVTGGGAYNQDFLRRLEHYFKGQLIIPSSEIIEFKEALIFAYLGLLRVLEKENVLCSVTGASRNSCCGAVNLP